MRPELSLDGQATLLLCSELGLPPDPEPARRPFSLKEWNELSPLIAASSLGSPAGFLRDDPAVWQTDLGLGNEQASRIVNLLDRKANLAIELERLGNLGIWVITRADEGYPCRLKKILGRRCPVVVYGAGDHSILQTEGIAVVGSRDVDQAGLDFAIKLGAACARQGLSLVSGGAKGVDQAAQGGAFEAGGHVISVSSQGLESAVRGKDVRNAIFEERLVLLSTAHPRAPFNVGRAMERNKYIYALSLAAVVVSSAVEKGGTWAGATENLKHGWVPLFARAGDDVPKGNERLLKAGANPISAEALVDEQDLRSLLVGGPEGVSTAPPQATLEVKEPEPPYLEEEQAVEAFTYTRQKLADELDVTLYRLDKLVKQLGLQEDPAMHDGAKKRYSAHALEALRNVQGKQLTIG